MKGFEFACMIYAIKPAHVAEKLGISRQRVNSWVKGGSPVSLKHLPSICNIFPDIPRQYFNAELENIDKIEMQYFKLAGDCRREGLSISEVEDRCRV